MVSEPLVAAAMCLKNVLLLVDSTLREEKLSARPSGCDVAEAEANLLEDAALLKLAWVQLGQRDHVSALRHSKRILEKNSLLPASHADQRIPQSEAGQAPW